MSSKLQDLSMHNYDGLKSYPYLGLDVIGSGDIHPGVSATCPGYY